ncbi:MAG: sensor histidine kinase [Nonomuraea sp.]|nr:sensor histidine kinase [Nonomuraea sp.]
MVTLVRPFALALAMGQAEPPPPPSRSRWLTPPVPRPLAALVPVKAFSLVQAAELVLAVILYLTTSSTVETWNVIAPAVPGGPARLASGFLHLTALSGSLPLALRGRWPLGAWRIAALLAPVAIHTDLTIGRDEGYWPYMFPMALTYLLVLYSVGVRCEPRVVLAVWIITGLIGWAADRDTAVFVLAITGVALLLGYNVSARRRATARLVQEERRTRRAEGAHAVLEERARIARELHDVVAHHMSVIAIQAEAVPLKAAGDPVQLEAGLAEIRALSVEAITELRQVLCVLRDADGRVDTAPQPGLDRVDDLVANARGAGLAVRVRRPRPLDGLPPTVGLSAYRIVQESLSNAMRYAPGASVDVDLVRESDTLRLRVANGPGVSPGAAPGAGQGLVGMRERVALLGGALDAGPAPGGGYQVSATLPIEEREGA